MALTSVKGSMITSSQFAAKQGLTRQRINQLIHEGKITPKPVRTQVLGGPKRGIWVLSSRAKIIA